MHSFFKQEAFGKTEAFTFIFFVTRKPLSFPKRLGNIYKTCKTNKKYASKVTWKVYKKSFSSENQMSPHISFVFQSNLPNTAYRIRHWFMLMVIHVFFLGLISKKNTRVDFLLLKTQRLFQEVKRKQNENSRRNTHSFCLFVWREFFLECFFKKKKEMRKICTFAQKIFNQNSCRN